MAQEGGSATRDPDASVLSDGDIEHTPPLIKEIGVAAIPADEDENDTLDESHSHVPQEDEKKEEQIHDKIDVNMYYDDPYFHHSR